VGDLLAATRDLMAVPSPSRNEAALAGLVEDALRACPWLELERIGDNVIAAPRSATASAWSWPATSTRFLPNGNQDPRLEGDTLWGLGASDKVQVALSGQPVDPAVDARRHGALRAVEEVVDQEVRPRSLGMTPEPTGRHQCLRTRSGSSSGPGAVGQPAAASEA
jgi:hypothetical protein